MQIPNLKNLTLKLINLGHMRNSSPVFAGLPFRFANKRVSGSGFQLLSKSPSAPSDTCQPLDAILPGR